MKKTTAVSVFIALAIMAGALYMNRNIPSVPKALPIVTRPQPTAPIDAPVGVMGEDGKVRVVYQGATPAMKKP